MKKNQLTEERTAMEDKIEQILIKVDEGTMPVQQALDELLVIFSASEGEEKCVCGDCGRPLTLVRPGKHQCDNRHCKSHVRSSARMIGFTKDTPLKE